MGRMSACRMPTLQSVNFLADLKPLVANDSQAELKVRHRLTACRVSCATPRCTQAAPCMRHSVVCTVPHHGEGPREGPRLSPRGWDPGTFSKEHTGTLAANARLQSHRRGLLHAVLRCVALHDGVQAVRCCALRDYPCAAPIILNGVMPSVPSPACLLAVRAHSCTHPHMHTHAVGRFPGVPA